MHVISLVGTVLALSLAIEQLALRQRTYKNWLVFALFFDLGCVLGASYLFYSDVVFAHPALINLHTPFILLIAPLLYFVYRILLEGEYKLKPVSLLHFVLPVASIAILIPYYATPGAEKLALFRETLRFESYDLASIFYAIGAGLLFAYHVYMLVSSAYIWKWQNLRNELTMRTVAIFLAFTTVTVAFLNLAFVLRDLLFMHIANASLTIIFLAFKLAGRRYPEFASHLRTVVEREKQSVSVIENLDLAHVASELKRLFEAEKIYRDYDLSLGQVAAALQIRPDQLSQYLNKHQGKSFVSFSNEYRVKEAMRLLKEDADLTVLTAAYAVGFNSKSSFNQAFKKVTGLTPSQFRQQG